MWDAEEKEWHKEHLLDEARWTNRYLFPRLIAHAMSYPDVELFWRKLKEVRKIANEGVEDIVADGCSRTEAREIILEAMAKLYPWLPSLAGSYRLRRHAQLMVLGLKTPEQNEGAETKESISEGDERPASG